MPFDFADFKKRLTEVEAWLGEELMGVRTGRAAPAVLDSVMVDSYGAKTPLKHVAGISIEDARTLRVAPWDKGQVKAIEKAIGEANIGVSASADESGIRVFFPELTEDRRKMLTKLAKEKLEDARISVRKERDEVQSDVNAKEKAGDISEDEKFRLKDEMQKYVDATNKKLDELLEKKEREILG